MAAAAVVCLTLVDWTGFTGLSTDAALGLFGLLVIGVMSEGLAIGLSVGKAASTSSIFFLPLLGAMQLFGPAPAVVLVLVTQLFVQGVIRRKHLARVVFNVSQAVVGTVIGGALWTFLGGVPLEVVGEGSAPSITDQLLPFIAFGFVFLAVNHAAVAMAITLSQRLPFRRVWGLVRTNSGGSLNDLLIAPIALAIAYLYVQFRLGGIVVVLLPMLFVRYSYMTNAMLRDSNADLLTALVKAIETRDPYTSGHSLRVSQLAERIAEAMGLTQVAVEHVRQAALLHDIGKIEAVYTDILRKPDALSPEERAIIESHVTKGEQLLRDLPSVPEAVSKAVRHHHEREDGEGYPDRLMGDEIPVGAKIIAVCDAVDAMLSDRPYRKALGLTVVLQQLEEHRGKQFDHRVVKALVSSDILAEYAETMRTTRENAGAVGDETSAEVVPLPVSLLQPPRPRIRRYKA